MSGQAAGSSRWARNDSVRAANFAGTDLDGSPKGHEPGQGSYVGYSGPSFEFATQVVQVKIKICVNDRGERSRILQDSGIGHIHLWLIHLSIEE